MDRYTQGRLREECLRQANADWELYENRGCYQIVDNRNQLNFSSVDAIDRGDQEKTV